MLRYPLARSRKCSPDAKDKWESRLNSSSSARASSLRKVHAANEVVKPRIRPDIVPEDISFQTLEINISFLVGLLQPGKCIVPFSQKRIHFGQRSRWNILALRLC